MKKFGSQLCQHRNFLYFAVCSFLHEFQARNLSGGLRGWWFGIMYGGCRDGRRWKGLAAACPLRVQFYRLQSNLHNGQPLTVHSSFRFPQTSRARDRRQHFAPNSS